MPWPRLECFEQFDAVSSRLCGTAGGRQEHLAQPQPGKEWMGQEEVAENAAKQGRQALPIV